MYIGDKVPGKIIRNVVKKHIGKGEEIKGITAQRRAGRLLNFVVATDKQLVLWTTGPFISEKPIKEARIRYSEYRDVRMKSGIFSKRLILISESKKTVLKNFSETDAAGLANIIKSSMDEERKRLEANKSKNTAKERLMNITAARRRESERVRAIS